MKNAHLWACLFLVALTGCGGGGGGNYVSDGDVSGGSGHIDTGTPQPEPNEVASEPPPEQNNPVTSDAYWVEIPGSSMNTVFDESIDIGFDFDDYPYISPALDKVWPHIQEGWSGGVVAGEWFYVHGGGHGGSPHNGVFRVNINGEWERFTTPSPLWTTENCTRVNSAWTCTMPTGETCPLPNCAQMPDGQPGSIHSYNLLASDGEYLYRSGGSFWSGSSAVGPQNWRLNLATREWETFSNDQSSGYGSLFYADEKLYRSTQKGAGVYDIATDTWSDGHVDNETWNKFGWGTTIDVCNGYAYAIGGGVVQRTLLERFPSGWEKLPSTAARSARGPGVACYKNEVWVWHGGIDLEVFDGDDWRIETPVGTGPGAEINNGTFGRLFVLSGKLCVVNGVDKNMFCIGASPGPDPLPETNELELLPGAIVSQSDGITGGCVEYDSTPVIVPDPRNGELEGVDWGHTIRVKTAIGPAKPPHYQSCADAPDDFACIEVDPRELSGFPHAVDSLPPEGGIILLKPGIHVTKENYGARKSFDLLHLQGIPDECGRRPVLRSALTYATINPETGRYDKPREVPPSGINLPQASKNLIVDGIELQNFGGSCMGAANSIYQDDVDQTVLVKDSFIHHCWFVGVHMGKGDHYERTGRFYILDSELGYIWAGAHMLYSSGGRTFYTENSYYHSAGWHAFKVLAHNIAVIDSTLSQVGLDGEVAQQVGARNDGDRSPKGAAASLLSCQRGVFKGNTFIQQDGMTIARQRRPVINGCDIDGSFYPRPGYPPLPAKKSETYPAHVTQFWDESFWDEVAAGGNVQDGNKLLLPIFWYDNTFINTKPSNHRFVAQNSSTWPFRDTPMDAGGPADRSEIPDGWVERSRDVFLNNTFDGFGKLYKCDSKNPELNEQCESIMLIDAGGNNSKPVPVPNWFVTDPLEISAELYPLTIEEIHSAVLQEGG